MVKKVRKMFDTEGGLSFLGYALSFHAIALGLSFALDTADAKRTLLYESISSFPVIEPEIFGWVLAISGFIAFIGYFGRKLRPAKELVKYSSYVQFLVYLFMTFLYLLNGLFWYAASVAVPWVPLVWIVSYAFYYLPKKMTQAEELAYFGIKPKNE